MAYIYLTIAIVAEVIATTALKSSDGFTRALPTSAAVCGYLIAFYCLSLALRSLPTGVAYAIWSGIGTVSIALLAYYFHGQRLNAMSIFGIALILAGVVVLNISSQPQAA